jgi:hypothetical protein
LHELAIQSYTHARSRFSCLGTAIPASGRRGGKPVRRPRLRRGANARGSGRDDGNCATQSWEDPVLNEDVLSIRRGRALCLVPCT